MYKNGHNVGGTCKSVLQIISKTAGAYTLLVFMEKFLMYFANYFGEIPISIDCCFIPIFLLGG